MENGAVCRWMERPTCTKGTEQIMEIIFIRTRRQNTQEPTFDSSVPTNCGDILLDISLHTVLESKLSALYNSHLTTWRLFHSEAGTDNVISCLGA